MKEISDKQLKANRANSKLGGVKTDEGKQKSKYNAVKHNVLTSRLTKAEAKAADYLREQLSDIYRPTDLIGEMLVERAVVWWVRLQRAVFAETEQIKAIENPREVKTGLSDLDFGETKVIKEGYTPKFTNEQIETFINTQLRYETSIERQFYKALTQLTDYKAGENS